MTNKATFHYLTFWPKQNGSLSVGSDLRKALGLWTKLNIRTWRFLASCNQEFSRQFQLMALHKGFAKTILNHFYEAVNSATPTEVTVKHGTQKDGKQIFGCLSFPICNMLSKKDAHVCRMHWLKFGAWFGTWHAFWQKKNRFLDRLTFLFILLVVCKAVGSAIFLGPVSSFWR